MELIKHVTPQNLITLINSIQILGDRYWLDGPTESGLD